VQDCADLGSQPSRMEIMHVWITGVAGLEVVARQSGDHADLCRPEEHDWTEWISVQACADLGSRPLRTEIVSVDHQSCSPWGHGLAEWRSCRPVQA
jgi:hypothetical protein